MGAMFKKIIKSTQYKNSAEYFQSSSETKHMTSSYNLTVFAIQTPTRAELIHPGKL